MGTYVLSIDQSTQGTKAMLFSPEGERICRRDVPHRQIMDEKGWISHDPVEIYENVKKSAAACLEAAAVEPAEVACLSISNQRETSLVWERSTGKPVCNAIVWQCARSADICRRVLELGKGDMICERTGLPVSPYFPASKLAWVLENIPGAAALAGTHALCFGTVDTWLIYCLTDGKSYRTDYSNASRTQLLNLRTLEWDMEICRVFGLCPEDLAELWPSDGIFGYTDLDGLLPKAVPICGVLGDSHGALFGQGCLRKGMTKATYGTGSSVMMNIGERPISSAHGLATSLAWKRQGQVQYVMEGNINYTGAVIAWMQQELGLLSSAAESELLAKQADPMDTTYLVPAFSGLGAPYWNSEARASISGMTRRTGRAELVKAAVECIAYQITDVVKAMEADTGLMLRELRADGGAARNGYLMQFQSDLLDAAVLCPEAEELSGMGAAFMGGLALGLYREEKLWQNSSGTVYAPRMAHADRARRYSGWRDAVKLTTERQK